MNKRFLITLATLILIALGAGAAVFLTKGYTFSPGEKRVVGTGIVSVTSVPDGASVYIDGHLTTATNATIPSLSPKVYNLKITKEGFVPWEKNIEVKEGLVSEIKATLFPAIPFAYPLTYNGVGSASISPDGQKLVFLVPIIDDQHSRQKGGIWVWTMSSQALSLNRGAEPHQLAASTSALDFSKANLRWSPDSKQVLVKLYEGGREEPRFERNYLLSADQYTSLNDLRDITPLVPSTIKGWEDDEKNKKETQILAIKDLQTRKIASDAGVLKWSPDESKFMAGGEIASLPAVTRNDVIARSETTKQSQFTVLKGFKVYDLGLSTTREGMAAFGVVKSYDLPEALDYVWLPDSKHIILIQKDQVSIVESDGKNEAVIYAGSFGEEGLPAGRQVFPWPDSSRLVVVTSTSASPKLNLFGINLK